MLRFKIFLLFCALAGLKEENAGVKAVVKQTHLPPVPPPVPPTQKAVPMPPI